jgi:co-chaperonin GroES (HSP10)
MEKLKLRGNRILVRFDEPDKMVGSIHIPQVGTASCWGTVVDIGPGIRLEDGTYVKPDVDIGDKVFCGPYIPRGDNPDSNFDPRLVIMMADCVIAKISKS